ITGNKINLLSARIQVDCGANLMSGGEMGLCKCPRKKVTNLFCFEHRVNVCEHCLVENHHG
ncbi:hypothetical protein ANCDUO_21920, partial [Ancylostoma duodenale]